MVDDESIIRSLVKVANGCTDYEFEFYNDDVVGLDTMYDYNRGKGYINIEASGKNIAICGDYNNGIKANSLADCQEKIMKMLEEPIDCSFVLNDGFVCFYGPTIFFDKKLFEKDPDNLACILPNYVKAINAIGRAADKIFLD